MSVADDRHVGADPWTGAYRNDPTWVHMGPGARV